MKRHLIALLVLALALCACGLTDLAFTPHYEIRCGQGDTTTQLEQGVGVCPETVDAGCRCYPLDGQ